MYKYFLIIQFLLMGVLSGCMEKEPPDLSGLWENDKVGQLVLKQTGNVLYAEQKSPDFIEFFGPKMFEGTIEDGVLKGKVASAFPADTKKICGKNWGSWTEIELRVAEDGLSLEGQWLKSTNNTQVKGCPNISSEWTPFKLTRGAGQEPVKMKGTPNWVVAALVAFGLLLSFGIRQAWVAYLVNNLKRSPSRSSNSGWMLFLSINSIFAFVSANLVTGSFANMYVLVAIAAVAIITLGLAGFSARKK
jgi:hypothetical protein